jgi:hypothetical protein
MSDSTRGLARKTVLSVFRLAQTCSSDDPDAKLVTGALEPYYVKPVMLEQLDDGQPASVSAPAQFNLLPLVLSCDGEPWVEANLYTLEGLEESASLDMRAADAKALDLADYRRFVETNNIDWTDFPQNKHSRPTYKYRRRIKLLLDSGEISQELAKRRIGTVVAFYRWLRDRGLFAPAHPAWVTKDKYITTHDRHGFPKSRKVESTDLAIPDSKQDDPFAGYIEDGGKLRPLPAEEQEWLMDALSAVGSPEMTIIILFALVTGARLQTVCTLKLHHLHHSASVDPYGCVRIPVGPGTGVETKNSKPFTLHIPDWMYRALIEFSNSPRSVKRRNLAIDENHRDYVFLTKNGIPFYEDKRGRASFNPANKRRYDLDGGAVSQFIRAEIRPYVEEKYGVKKFHFRYHDTRATFGMNLADFMMKLVEKGGLSLAEARDYVRVRLAHNSSEVTDRYINFRKHQKLVRVVIENHEKHLKDIMQQVCASSYE